MFPFKNEEYANIHFVYGFCKKNSCRAEEKYCLLYPHVRALNHVIFALFHQRLMKTSSFDKLYERGTGLPLQHFRGVCTRPSVPSVSSRILAKGGIISQSEVMIISNKIQNNPYHFTSV